MSLMPEKDSDFEFIFDISVISYLEKLNPRTKERIFNKLVLAKKEPFRFFVRLVGRSDFKLRVGKHRIIADIVNHKIIVTLIDLRKNVYKT